MIPAPNFSPFLKICLQVFLRWSFYYDRAGILQFPSLQELRPFDLFSGVIRPNSVGARIQLGKTVKGVGLAQR